MSYLYFPVHVVPPGWYSALVGTLIRLASRHFRRDLGDRRQGEFRVADGCFPGSQNRVMFVWMLVESMAVGRAGWSVVGTSNVPGVKVGQLEVGSLGEFARRIWLGVRSV